MHEFLAAMRGGRTSILNEANHNGVQNVLALVTMGKKHNTSGHIFAFEV